LKVLPIEASCYLIGLFAGRVRCMGSHFGKSRSLEVPSLSPGSVGIMNLAGNIRVIYGAQSVTGKVFLNKELRGIKIPVHMLIMLEGRRPRQGLLSQASGVGRQASGFRAQAVRLRGYELLESDATWSLFSQT